jgi:transposase-like protein
MYSEEKSATININNLIDEAQCYRKIREIRWSNGVRCPKCKSDKTVKNGHNDRHKECQRYNCKSCNAGFDDLSGTVFAKHHQPVTKWILCLYFMGLNLSNRQIAQELEINETDCQQMTTLLRGAVYENTPDILLSGEVECDEVYIVAGHKGHPEMVKKGDENRGATV